MTDFTPVELPTQVSTVKLKHPRKLEIEARLTMRSHIFFRYADDAATIKLQLQPEEARELAEKLIAAADFCDQTGIAA